MLTEKKIKIALSAAVIVLVVCMVFLIQVSSNKIYTASLDTSASDIAPATGNQNSSVSASQQNQPAAKPTPAPAPAPVQKPVGLDAVSAISVQINPDGSEKVLYEKQGQKEVPVASLTKLMTALLVLERYDLNQQVTIDQNAMNQVGEQGDLKLGDVLTVKDLLYITLIESSNRSAYALSEVMGNDAFIAAMNQRAIQLGMTHTHFADSSGLDSNSQSTVEDLVKLTQYLYQHYPLFGQIISQQTYNVYRPDGTLHHTLVSTNELFGKVSGMVGGKTGFTDDALGCFMMIQNDSDPSNGYMIHIVLGSNDRFAAMLDLINNYDAK